MFAGYNPSATSSSPGRFAAMLCGLAGALYVPQVGIINPSELAPANSIEIAIWVAVGGRGTLVGAALGALLVNGVKSYLTVGVPGLLAVLPRRAVRAGHAVLPERPRRPDQAAASGARARPRRHRTPGADQQDACPRKSRAHVS